MFKKAYKKNLMKRFVIYPAIVGFFSYQLFEFFAATELGSQFIAAGPVYLLTSGLGLDVSFESVKYLYAYAIGYSYGSMSVLISIRKLRLGFFGLLLMYVKYVIAALYVAPFAMLLLPVELLLALVVSILKVFKPSFQRKTKKHKTHERNIYATMKENL